MASDRPPPVDAFERAYRASNEAFNRHDFEAAFQGFNPGIEWDTVAGAPGPGRLSGTDAVIEGFVALLDEFPDWHVEPQEFIDAGDCILVRNLATATGRGSRVPIRQPFTQLWTFRDGRPVHVREFFDHAEALEAAVEHGVRAGYAAFVAGDLDRAMESFAPDVALVNPEYALERGVRQGIEGIRSGFETLHEQFSFESIEIQEVVTGTDVVVVMIHIRAEGRHSGVPLEQGFAHVWHMRDGQPVSFEWFLTREEGLAAAGLA